MADDVEDILSYTPERDAPIVGAVPTVERQQSHRDFLAAASPEVVLLPITEARKLAHDGLSFDDWLPDSVMDQIDVVTSTTVSDDQLLRTSWEKELEIIKTVAPEYHIPADYPVYADDDPEDREYNCMRCAAGTAWIAREVRESGLETTIIPLIKGTTPDERAICERQAADLGADMIAFYGGQYFGEGGGGGRSRLVEDVAAINEETATLPMLVIGGLSPWVGRELPKNVVATAGLRAWRETVTPRSGTVAEIKNRYQQLAHEVDDALNIVDELRTTIKEN